MVLEETLGGCNVDGGRDGIGVVVRAGRRGVGIDLVELIEEGGHIGALAARLGLVFDIVLDWEGLFSYDLIEVR